MSKPVFKLQYEKHTKDMLYVVLAIFCALTIRQALCLFNVWIKPYNIVLDSCSLGVCAIIVIIVASLLFHSRYVVKNSSIYVKMGFFGQKIPCGLVTSVAKFKEVGYFMFYTTLNAKPAQIKINVTDDDFDGFFKAIKGYNPLITYDVVQKDAQ